MIFRSTSHFVVVLLLFAVVTTTVTAEVRVTVVLDPTSVPGAIGK